MSGVELMWVWKLFTVMEDRSEDWIDCGALGNDVLSEEEVFGDSMRDTQGDEGDEALDFVDHGICVGHLGPVSHTRFSGSSHYPVDLFLNFLLYLWVFEKQQTVVLVLSVPARNKSKALVIRFFMWKLELGLSFSSCILLRKQSMKS